jgi:IS4 transposase
LITHLKTKDFSAAHRSENRPRSRQGCPGKFEGDSKYRSACPANPRIPEGFLGAFWLSRLRKSRAGHALCSYHFRQTRGTHRPEAVRGDRRAARRDAYDKSFFSWDHLVTLIFAQLSDLDSLRALQAGWNASSQHHYHLASGALSHSTLSDANKRRPVAVFADAFEEVAKLLDRQCRGDSHDFVRLIDSTPIPLGKLCPWAKSNGRIRGMKVHVVYDPHHDLPRILDISHANVNDAQIGRAIGVASGATYVFDKGYVHYKWWTAIHQAGSFFVTRPKGNMGLRVVKARDLQMVRGDRFTVLSDEEAAFASKGDSKLPIPLRRVRVQRDNGKTLSLLTNDMTRSAVAIAALYKARWQIELLFRWIKQHPQIPQVPRPQRECDQAADLRRHDRLRPPQARRQNPQGRPSHPAVHRPRAQIPVRTTRSRRHRKAPTRQSQLQTRQKLARSVELALCVNFPRTALRFRGEFSFAFAHLDG